MIQTRGDDTGTGAYQVRSLRSQLRRFVQSVRGDLLPRVEWHLPDGLLTDAAKVELALVFDDVGDLGEAGG